MQLDLRVALGLLGKGLGVELAGLSQVDNPVGRVDYLASKFIEQGVRAPPPEVQMTYHTIRPLLDGLITQRLGSVPVKVPDEVRQLFYAGKEGIV